MCNISKEEFLEEINRKMIEEYQNQTYIFPNIEVSDEDSNHVMNMAYVDFEDEGHLFIEWNIPNSKPFVDNIVKAIEDSMHKQIKTIEVPNYVIESLKRPKKASVDINAFKEFVNHIRNEGRDDLTEDYYEDEDEMYE